MSGHSLSVLGQLSCLSANPCKHQLQKRGGNSVSAPFDPSTEDFYCKAAALSLLPQLMCIGTKVIPSCLKLCSLACGYSICCGAREVMKRKQFVGMIKKHKQKASTQALLLICMVTLLLSPANTAGHN
ncbi:hypothetical protein MHYP_G00172800, partial [Metynnis hypsauchen]